MAWHLSTPLQTATLGPDLGMSRDSCPLGEALQEGHEVQSGQ